MKTERLNQGQINVPIDMGGVTVVPGMMVYADKNGVAVSDEPLDLAIVD
ncbi:MAG: hypothetical protein ACRCVV_04880 [Shewanella sp.]